MRERIEGVQGTEGDTAGTSAGSRLVLGGPATSDNKERILFKAQLGTVALGNK